MNRKRKKLLIVLLSLLLTPIFINALIILLSKLKTKRYTSKDQYYTWRHGRVYYKVKGKGKPVLLLHGIGAGASSFEFRKNFDELAHSYRVYAIDLLGFGKSEHPAITYTGFLYVQLIIDFIQNVVGERVHIISSSHSTAYSIAAANLRPELIDKLILISPLGISQNKDFPTSMDALLKKVYQSPLAGTSFYHMLASKYSIEKFLRNQVYYNEVFVSDYIVEEYYHSAHLGGVNSKYAPACFLTQFLNLPVEEAFSCLSNDLCIVWGADCKINPLENLDEFIALQPESRIEIFEEARLLPHEEHAETFNEIVKDFLR